MPRRSLQTGGYVFHVVNRGAHRFRLFDTPRDYGAFAACLKETQDRFPLSLFAYCIMPNHFHLVCRPAADGDMFRFMKRLTGTHARRWNSWRDQAGHGSVYQGRYRASAVKEDRHFLMVCRYVERNPLRARLVRRAEDWRWSSLGQRSRNLSTVRLDPWPILQPLDWLERVNQVEGTGDLEVIRHAAQRGAPLGDEVWRSRTAALLGAEASLNPQGRPLAGGKVVG